MLIRIALSLYAICNSYIMPLRALSVIHNYPNGETQGNSAEWITDKARDKGMVQLTTRVQCRAILPSHECNDRFIIYTLK